MRKVARQSLIILIVINLMVLSGWSPALAQYSSKVSERSGGKMTADMLLLRPAGFLATLAGSAVFLISLPLSALGGNHREAFDKLVKEPAKYTFERPLGDF